MKKYIMPYFIPFQGCPFKCIYCDQTAISGDNGIGLAEALEKFASEHKNEQYSAEVAFFGGTFSLLDREKQHDFLKIANDFIRKGAIQGIRFSTRPDALDDGLLEYYRANRVNHIELGVQSFNDKYLEMLNRGYKADSVMAVIDRIKSHGISVGVQMMMGFPGQTETEFMEDINTMIAAAPSDCRLYPLTVLKGTELERRYYQDDLKIMGMETAVDWVAGAADMIEAAGIEIRRIGLPHSVELQKNVVAGLYHPSFADKVRFRMLNKAFDNITIKPGDVILVNQADLQYANRIMRSKKINNKILPDKDMERSKAAIQ